jgi:serine/threonine protein kinase
MSGPVPEGSHSIRRSIIRRGRTRNADSKSLAFPSERDGASFADPVVVQSIHSTAAEVVTLSDGRSIVLGEALGRGSFGTVCRGLLGSGWGLQRPVAVKLLSLQNESDAMEVMPNLARIGQRWANVRHPSVVQLWEVDRTDGVFGEMLAPFFVTELVEGESLAALLDGWKGEGRRAPTDFATVVALRAAEALGAALFTDRTDGSLTQLVHGDLSPRQILISNQGEVKVGDFGQFVFSNPNSYVRSRARLTYTAPEIAYGADPDARSDVFSLGVLLHEMLVGPRFGFATDTANAIRMVHDGVVAANMFDPNLPSSLRAIIERATQRNPLERYPHARAMAFDLRREMLRLGLCDAQTCVRSAVVGWSRARSSEALSNSLNDFPPRRVSGTSEVANSGVASAFRGRR